MLDEAHTVAGEHEAREEDTVAAEIALAIRHTRKYARDLPVELNSRVTGLRQADDGYVVELAERSYEADQVVIATGPFQVPFIPPIAGRLDPEVVQLHSTEYRNPDTLPSGRVLVVGGGNTGFQIAEELIAWREVHLAIGSRQTPLPQRILGRDLFRYLDRLGKACTKPAGT